MPTPNEQRWLASWKVASSILQDVDREELANLSDERGAQQATYLGTTETTQASSDSGLRQWQILMMKL